MPYTAKQHRLFEFVSHNPGKARAEGIKIPQKTAAKMAHEGIKTEAHAMKHLSKHHK